MKNNSGNRKWNMKKLRKSIFISFGFVIILIVLSGYSSGMANSSRTEDIPVQPDYVYGKVMINGVYVPQGTSVSAWCSGVLVAETTTIIETVEDEDQSWYSLEIPPDDPGTEEKDGCNNNEQVVFKISSFDAEQTKNWVSGGTPPYILDLSADIDQQVFLPLIVK